METALPLHTLLAELDDMGCTVVIKGGKTEVTPPKRAAHKARFAVVLRSLRARREEVLAHFQGAAAAEAEPAKADGTRCRECGGLVFTDDPAVQQMCHMLMCPQWNKDAGVGPEWLAKERNSERFRRGQK